MIPWHIAMGGSTINAAYKTGLLEAIIHSPNTASEFASDLGLHLVGTERVLELMKELGLAEIKNGSYAASESLQRFEKFPGGFQGVFNEIDTIEGFLRSGATSWQGSKTAEERERNYKDTVIGMAEIWPPVAEELAGLDQREAVTHPRYWHRVRGVEPRDGAEISVGARYRTGF